MGFEFQQELSSEPLLHALKTCHRTRWKMQFLPESMAMVDPLTLNKRLYGKIAELIRSESLEVTCMHDAARGSDIKGREVVTIFPGFMNEESCVQKLKAHVAIHYAKHDVMFVLYPSLNEEEKSGNSSIGMFGMTVLTIRKNLYAYAKGPKKSPKFDNEWNSAWGSNGAQQNEAIAKQLSHSLINACNDGLYLELHFESYLASNNVFLSKDLSTYTPKFDASSYFDTMKFQAASASSSKVNSIAEESMDALLAAPELLYTNDEDTNHPPPQPSVNLPNKKRKQSENKPKSHQHTNGINDV
jgi:hypothetical protein